MSEDTPKNANYNSETGVVLSYMMYDVAGEKLIVKVADEDPALAVVKLMSVISLLNDDGYETLAQRKERLSNQSAPEKESRGWGKKSESKTDEPTGDDPMSGSEGNFLVKKIAFVKTKKGNLACVIEGLDDGEAVWISDKYAKGEYERWFPQKDGDGNSISAFTDGKFQLTREGSNNTLYDVEDGNGDLLCHWRRNGDYVNIVNVELA